MTLVARITACLLILISFYAKAQYTSAPAGRFEIDNIKGCEGLQINIKYNEICDDCVYQVLRGSAEIARGSNATSIVVNEAGSFRLQILFRGQPPGSTIDFVDFVLKPRTPPTYELYTCAANRVAFNITDTNFDNYVVDFGDGTPPVTIDRSITLQGSHAYASSGNRTISITGRDDNAPFNCAPGNQTINAMATLPIPTITQLNVLDPTSIRIAFNGQPNIVYRLEAAPNNAPSFQVLKTLYNVTSDTIKNLQTDDNFYCYRLGVVNPCTGAIQYSPVICSANVDLTVANNRNALNWLTRTTGVTNFRVTRTTAGSTLDIFAPASPYNDDDIFCGREYCYRLTTIYPNGSTSTSLQKCGTAISSDIPEPLENVSSIVNGNAADLLWLPNPSFAAEEYFVQKNINNNFSSVQSTASTSFSDPAYANEAGACYKIYYNDVCGNRSETTSEVCPIRLTGSVQNNNAVSLTWTEYNGWANGVNTYTVQKFTPEGALLQTFSIGTNTSFLDDTEDLLHQSLAYVVTATPVQPGVAASVSNRIIVIKKPNLFYPRAFTPNGDNLNDIFNVYGQFIDGFEMSIFNRWGELMYTTTELAEGWDGTFKGNPMPEGTYTFIVRILDRAGRDIKESGSVLLLRKN